MRLTSLLVCAISLGGVGCGGDGKPAENASNGDCPAGMVKQGGDCVAPDGESGPGKDNGSSANNTTSTTATSTSTTSTVDPTPTEPKTAYDKDNVEGQFRRAAAQIKANCGAATDDTGTATGPWGATKASVRLGRNGHVRGVELPAPYDGKPAGMCAVHAFRNLIFPPYAAPSDVVVEWDIELVKPAGVK